MAANKFMNVELRGSSAAIHLNLDVENPTTTIDGNNQTAEPVLDEADNEENEREIFELSSDESDDVPSVEVDDANDEEFDIDRETSDSPQTSELTENFSVNIASKLAAVLVAQEDDNQQPNTSVKTTTVRKKGVQRGKNQLVLEEAAKFITQNELACQTRLQKELKNLQFVNPGGATASTLETIGPEKALLESLPKLRVRRQRKNFQGMDEGTSAIKKKTEIKLRHGRTGEFLLSNGVKVDLCDCLDEHCLGCHPPCRKCESCKCSFICRNNRNSIVEYVEVAGTNRRKHNPYLSNQKLN